MLHLFSIGIGFCTDFIIAISSQQSVFLAFE
jgi:hypothetical protein